LDSPRPGAHPCGASAKPTSKSAVLRICPFPQQRRRSPFLSSLLGFGFWGWEGTAIFADAAQLHLPEKSFAASLAVQVSLQGAPRRTNVVNQGKTHGTMPYFCGADGCVVGIDFL
jgi:hypothetical protein